MVSLLPQYENQISNIVCLAEVDGKDKLPPVIIEPDNGINWERRNHVGNTFSQSMLSADIRASLLSLPFITHDKQVYSLL